MRSAAVVIGAGFGDEGKGLFVDYLCKTTRPDLVVRYNGGAQAGHTVDLGGVPALSRHVHHMFGCGTLRGIRTYLSPFVVVNPARFLDEARIFNIFHETACKDPVIVDELCPLTTIYDELINQFAEVTRGESRHGSCGIGFNETIERSNSSVNGKYRFLLNAKMLDSLSSVKDRLERIKCEWVPHRLRELSLSEEMFNGYASSTISGDINEAILNTLSKFKEKVLISREAVRAYKSLVFEGAQGLGLDENSGYFPNVTRSKTGCLNVFAVARYFGVKHLDLYYVTRAYQTRHGNGPLFSELGRRPYRDVVDQTNVDNKWQGKLRYAYLSADALAETVKSDVESARSHSQETGITFTPRLVVTCLDQVGKRVKLITDDAIIHGDDYISVPVKDLPAKLETATGVKVSHLSFGPTAATVKRLK